MLHIVSETNGRMAPAGRPWAYRHPVLVGVGVFCLLFVPLGLQGIVNRDWNEVVFPLPGALLLGGIWFALYRWGISTGRGEIRAPDAAGSSPAIGAAASNADRNLAQVCQLGVLFCPAVVPAVVLVACRRRPFVRMYAAQALNLQLVLSVALASMTATAVGTNSEGAAMSATYALCVVVYGYSLAVSLLGTVKAANGISWRYPVNVPLFR